MPITSLPVSALDSPDRVILGIDPGTNFLGYGIIRKQGRKVEMLAMGIIDLHKVADIYLKLGRIYERVQGIIDSYLPDEMAIEAPFFGCHESADTDPRIRATENQASHHR